MEGANDSQERIDRISELLGGSLKHAIDLVGNWGGSGWNAIPSWGNVLVDMLEIVIQPQTLGEGAKQLQHRWQEAIAHVATSQEEQAAMMAAVHQKAMLAWNACLLPLKEKQTSSIKPKQQRVGIEGFNMDTIERLTNMADGGERLHPTSPGVQQSIETLVIQTLEQEAKRRKTLKPDERILVSRNIHLLNLLSRVLCDQPLQPTFAKAATPHVNMIEKGYSSELDRLRAYLHRQNFLDISNTITRPANKRSLRF